MRLGAGIYENSAGMKPDRAHMRIFDDRKLDEGIGT